MLQKERALRGAAHPGWESVAISARTRLGSRPLIYDKGALCVAEACERGAGANQAWKAAASLRVSGITPGRLVCPCEEHKVD